MYEQDLFELAFFYPAYVDAFNKFKLLQLVL
jgi:hypothetical protein